MQIIGKNQPLWQKEEAHKTLSGWLVKRCTLAAANDVAWRVVA